MIPYLSQSSVHRNSPAPLVLIAEEDPRVLELMQLAFVAEQFRVVTALDGDEAIRRALAERPDALVLDLRLPRKNGFEVCDWLRHDPEDPHVPIVFVSTSGETEVRIEALSRGGDDFLAKPFSPRELVARVRRLLVRSGEARTQRRRATALERELAHAQDDVRTAHADLVRERRLRELAFGIGRALRDTLDLDELAERMLVAARRQLDCRSLALMVRDGDEPDAPLRVLAGLGEAWERLADRTLAPTGELGALLAGLARPALLHELDRWKTLEAELAPFAVAGVTLFAPVGIGGTLDAVLIADERADGELWSAADRDALAGVCELTAPALRTARRFAATQDRVLELEAGHAHTQPHAARAEREAQHIAQDAAAALQLPARERSLLRHAVAFGPWGWSEDGHTRLAQLAPMDPTRRVADLGARIACGESLELDTLGSRAARQTAAIAGVCARYQVGRGSGRSADESWHTALAWASSVLDPELVEALESAFGAREHAGDPRAA